MSESCFIPVCEPLFEGNEGKYLQECIETGWVSSEGPFVQKLEAGFAERCSRKYGVAVSSGTAALDVAVAALGLGPDDEVIVPTFTIISCISAILKAGATPVLVDIDSSLWTMNVEQIEKKITSKTKAIMVVHIYGLPADMDRITSLANRHGLLVIEDAAQMHGQTYRGQPCGSFGDISTFSFYSNKFITSGEGGMLLTNDENLAEQCRSLRNLCFSPGGKRFHHQAIGWNYRLSNLQAAVGVAQLEQLDKTVAKKREIAALYNERLDGVFSLQLAEPRTSYSKNHYWVYGIVLADEVKLNSEMLAAQLATLKIGTRPFFWPMHEQPVFEKKGMFLGERYPVSERLARRGLYLPNGVGMSEEQIARVVDALLEIIGASV